MSAINLVGRQYIKRGGKIYLVLTLVELSMMVDEASSTIVLPVQIGDCWCIPLTEKKL